MCMDCVAYRSVRQKIRNAIRLACTSMRRHSPKFTAANRYMRTIPATPYPSTTSAATTWLAASHRGDFTIRPVMLPPEANTSCPTRLPANRHAAPASQCRCAPAAAVAPIPQRLPHHACAHCEQHACADEAKQRQVRRERAREHRADRECENGIAAVRRRNAHRRAHAARGAGAHAVMRDHQRDGPDRQRDHQPEQEIAHRFVDAVERRHRFYRPSANRPD